MNEVILPAVRRIETLRPNVISFEVLSENQLHALNRLFYKQEHQKKNNYYQVRIKPPFRPRTTGKNSQCNRFNGGIQLICQETGNDFYDVKMYLKRKAIARGYPMQVDEKGNIVYSLIDGEPVPISESEASIEEAKLLIDELEELMSQFDIHWDDNYD